MDTVQQGFKKRVCAHGIQITVGFQPWPGVVGQLQRRGRLSWRPGRCHQRPPFKSRQGFHRRLPERHHAESRKAWPVGANSFVINSAPQSWPGWSLQDTLETPCPLLTCSRHVTVPKRSSRPLL